MARRKTTFVLNNEERKKNRAEEKFPKDYEFLIITYKVDASSNNDYIIYHSRPRESQLDRFTTWRTIEHCLQRLLCWIIDHFHSEIFRVMLCTKKLWVAGFCLLSSVVVKVTEAKLLANRVAVVTFLND